MRLFWIVGISLLLLTPGCAVVFPTMRADCPVDVTNNDVSAAVVASLQQHGFSVAVASPQIGLIVTDWRIVTTTGEEVANTLITGVLLGVYNAQEYRERIKLSFSVNRNNNTIVVQPHKQQRSQSLGWSDATLDNGDILLIQNTVVDAVNIMGGSLASLKWVYPPGYGPQIQQPSTKQEEEAPRALITDPGAGTVVIATAVIVVAAFVLAAQ